jgi:CRISPR/Cas system-associated protein Csm6
MGIRYWAGKLDMPEATMLFMRTWRASTDIAWASYVSQSARRRPRELVVSARQLGAQTLAHVLEGTVEQPEGRQEAIHEQALRTGARAVVERQSLPLAARRDLGSGRIGEDVHPSVLDHD